MATTKPTKASKVRAYQEKHPKASPTEVSKATGVDLAYIYAIRHSDKKPNVKVPKQKWKMLHMSTSDTPAMPHKEEAERIYELTKGRQRMHPVTGKMLMQGTRPATREEKISNPAVYEVTMEEPQADNVNHPAHYKVGGIETIDFIEAKGLNYHLGNVVKYITRADNKGNREEDLLKARWYLNREIAKFGK